jgi:hypothetical protein
MVCLLSQSRDGDSFLGPQWALGNNSFISWSQGAGSSHLLIKLSFKASYQHQQLIHGIYVPVVELDWHWSITCLSRVLFVRSCRCMFILDHTLHLPLGVTIEALFVQCCAVTWLPIGCCSTKQRRWVPLVSAVHLTHPIERVLCIDPIVLPVICNWFWISMTKVVAQLHMTLDLPCIMSSG